MMMKVSSSKQHSTDRRWKQLLLSVSLTATTHECRVGLHYLPSKFAIAARACVRQTLRLTTIVAASTAAVVTRTCGLPQRRRHEPAVQQRLVEVVTFVDLGASHAATAVGGHSRQHGCSKTNTEVDDTSQSSTSAPATPLLQRSMRP